MRVGLNNLPFYIERDKIINSLLDKYPNAGSLTLARMLKRDYPDYFINVENARSGIRHRRGSSGENHRKYLKNRKYVKVQPSGEL